MADRFQVVNIPLGRSGSFEEMAVAESGALVPKGTRRLLDTYREVVFDG